MWLSLKLYHQFRKWIQNLKYKPKMASIWISHRFNPKMMRYWSPKIRRERDRIYLLHWITLSQLAVMKSFIACCWVSKHLTKWKMAINPNKRWIKEWSPLHNMLKDSFNLMKASEKWHGMNLAISCMNWSLGSRRLWAFLISIMPPFI
jgi:hypothetical protein